ncbi:ssm4 protein, putative [Trypanosoma equiperdum]|uniref:Sm domain-containing protein n=3 Tax=Trypanozoon TaxID=39700 RepID=D6XJG9_TRYB2|nr:hypothetical protein, conserved [Trypanosoma brucei brucei TREU927]AAS57924.1 Lsm2p [Trypanosoma brucei]AAX80308.1 hypothetical protein, conserved [Trypanosoma brucei]AAZ12702.1 hypothetical protein, conserved [Trypanosoma brucei brucei TREU927]SCU64650.1 ssm4 protein, putative [Trypanosoma equiperdum]
MSVEASRPTRSQDPLPAAVIREFLEMHQQCNDQSLGQGESPTGTEKDGTRAAEARVVSAPLRVEVETTHGYVYEGRLVAMDEFYNVTLTEATKRRERLCDVERSLLTMHGFPAPAASPSTRREYVGSVLVRSGNLLMIRFPQGEGNATRVLHGAFKSMVMKVRRQINLERQKNRMERRRRKQLPVKPQSLVGKAGDPPKRTKAKKE